MITTDCKTFASSMRVAVQACPSRTPEETLQHVRLFTDNGAAILEATDHIHVVRQEIPAARVQGDINVLIPARRAMSVISQLSGDLTIQSAKDGECVFKCGRDRFRFMSPGIATYPKLQMKSESQCYHKLDADKFLAAIKSTIVSVDTKYGAFALGGIALDLPKEGTGFVVSTDGKRMSVVGIAGESSEEHSCDSTSTVVPVHAAKSLLAAIENSSSQVVYVTTYSSDVLFSSGGFTLISRLLEGRFPPWRKLMEKMRTEDLAVAKLGTKDLMAAIRKIMVFDDPESLGAVFKFGSGRLSIAKGDSAEVDVPVDGSEEAASLKMQPGLIKDWLSTIGNADDAAIRYAPSAKRVFICSGNCYFSLSTMESSCV